MSQPREPVVIEMPPPRAKAPASESSISTWLETATFVGMIAVLIFSPLVFGTTEPWSQFLQRSAASALLALWLYRQVSDRVVELSPNPIYLPVVLFGSIGIVQFVIGWTAYRFATLSELLNLAVYGVLILVASETMNRRRRLRAFMFAMAVFGFALAFFSILQGLSGTIRIYGLRDVRTVSASIYGPYANHNHYAGLMEMLIPLAIAAALLERGAKRAILLFGAVIMTLSIVFSRSRGGMISLAAGLLFVCVVLYRNQRNRRSLLGILSFSALVAAMVLLLGTDKVLERLSETQDAHRFEMTRDSLRAAVHKPLLGFGLGTFETVYPKYQSFSDDKLINHAHNDYAETLVDTGVLGLGIFVWFLTMVFRAGFAKLRDIADDEGRLLTFAAMTGIIAILVHTLFDFNLHIPANAALFFVLCAAVATPFKRRIRPMEADVWPDDIEPLPIGEQ